MHYGWVIVAAGMVVGACGYGTYYAFTLFYTEMVAEFGWSRTAVSGAMSLGMMAYGFFGLPMGWCVDWFGRVERCLLVGCYLVPGRRWVAVSKSYGIYTYSMVVLRRREWAPPGHR